MSVQIAAVGSLMGWPGRRRLASRGIPTHDRRSGTVAREMSVRIRGRRRYDRQMAVQKRDL